MATRGAMIGIDIRGVEPFVKYLDDIAKAEIAKKAAEEVAKYLVDVLKQYPPYRYVSRAEAYPEVVGSSPNVSAVGSLRRWPRGN